MLGRKLGFSGMFACSNNHQHVEKEKGTWICVCKCNVMFSTNIYARMYVDNTIIPEDFVFYTEVHVLGLGLKTIGLGEMELIV